MAEPPPPPPPSQPQLKLFNSMTKAKEPFQPRVEGKVGMYVCGVTPYDFSHVGHARAYVAFDMLYRYQTPWIWRPSVFLDAQLVGSVCVTGRLYLV